MIAYPTKSKCPRFAVLTIGTKICKFGQQKCICGENTEVAGLDGLTDKHLIEFHGEALQYGCSKNSIELHVSLIGW